MYPDVYSPRFSLSRSGAHVGPAAGPHAGRGTRETDPLAKVSSMHM